MNDNLIEVRCDVASTGDGFVGLRTNPKQNRVEVYFPMGYQLPSGNAPDCREDIRDLVHILAINSKRIQSIQSQKGNLREEEVFPIYAYLVVIELFLKTGQYYIEREPRYKTDTRGKVSWPRTVKNQRALVQENGSLVFTKLTVRAVSPDENKKITQIHKYCVHRAFELLGCIFGSFKLERPYTPNTDEAIQLLTKKLASTYNDEDQELFKAMRKILQYDRGRNPKDKSLAFGTERFDIIWEVMINQAFGVGKEERKKYFPKALWIFDDEANPQDSSSLRPDSIMVMKDGSCYVLDAKYYRYGIVDEKSADKKAGYLPGSSDINKQVAYGEYVKKRDESKEVFNAFIMPCNMRKNNPNPDNSDRQVMMNFGEAICLWKDNDNPEEHKRVQGIVLDTTFLMKHYMDNSEKDREALAECIRNGIAADSRKDLLEKAREQLNNGTIS